jgi:hypothetical protein
MIAKSGWRFSRLREAMVRHQCRIDASAGEGRSEKIMRKRNVSDAQ